MGDPRICCVGGGRTEGARVRERCVRSRLVSTKSFRSTDVGHASVRATVPTTNCRAVHSLPLEWEYLQIDNGKRLHENPPAEDLKLGDCDEQEPLLGMVVPPGGPSYPPRSEREGAS